MKRCLTTLLCALLLLGALPLSAGAESGAVVIEAPASCVPEEQIAVSLRVTGLKKCCGLSLCLEYDSSALALEGAGAASACPNAQVNAGEPGVIRFSFASATPVTLPNTVFHADFRVKSAAAGGTAALRVTEASASDMDQNALSLSLPAETAVSIAEAQPVSLVLLSETEADGSVTVRVLLAEGTYFCGMRFLLGYENCTLASCSGRKDSALRWEGTVFINPDYSTDRIFFSFASAEPRNRGGELLRARFTPGEGEAPVFFLDELRAYGTSNAVLTANWSPQADLVISTVYNEEDEEIQVTCAVTAETAMLIAGVYRSDGRMTDCVVGGAGPLAARTVELTLPEPDSGAAVKVFFLGADHVPRRQAAVLPAV